MNRALQEEIGVEYHQRQAVRFRSLAAAATTPAIKERLLMQAEEHERLARTDTDAPVTEPEEIEIP